MHEFTVYSARLEPLQLDEVRDRLAEYGFPILLLAESEQHLGSSRWFASLEPEGTTETTAEDETMVDTGMIVIDIQADPALVAGAVGSLAESLESAEQDEETVELLAALRSAKRSYFCAVDGSPSSGVRILQVAVLVACLDLTDGVLHDGETEEFFRRGSVEAFLKRELGAAAHPISESIGKRR